VEICRAERKSAILRESSQREREGGGERERDKYMRRSPVGVDSNNEVRKTFLIIR
jgi:hypothetical protein